MYYAHPSSIIEKGAKIGQNTKIWHFCHITAGAKIGEKCTLGQNVFVDGKVKIENYVKIHNNVSVYDGVTLKDYVFCGPSMVFTNDPVPRSKYPKKDFVKTLVKEGASIGAGAVIICGHTIGKHAFVGAGAVVVEDVSDYAVVVGVPARIVGWMCECGESLNFEDGKAQCQKCKRKYKKKDKKVREIS